MIKYFSVFKTSWQAECTYRLNFILWRVRNIFRLLMTYYLWQAAFITGSLVLGYTQAEITSYIFLVLVVQATVLSAPSAENIGSEISDGSLSNYLVKPIDYRLYWFTRDLASKVLNITFSLIEVGSLFLILRPEIAMNTSPQTIILTIAACIVSIIMLFFLRTTAIFISFWVPEFTWGISFLILVMIETLAGGIFPLDVLPQAARNILNFTPFPYLIYNPISIFLGKVTDLQAVAIIGQGVSVAIVLAVLNQYMWKKGLKTFSAYGG